MVATRSDRRPRRPDDEVLADPESSRGERAAARAHISKAWWSTEVRRPFNRPDWYDDAACRGMGPEVFHPPESDGHVTAGWQHRSPANPREAAMHICLSCDYRRECLELALTQPPSADSGIWGATTVSMRKKIRRRRGMPTE